MSVIRNDYYGTRESEGILSNTFVANVFLWMVAALGISGLAAYLVGTNENMLFLLFTETGSFSVLGWIVMLAPFGLVLVMSALIERMSFRTMALLYGLYAVLTGMSLGFIFWVFTEASILKTFLVTAGMFGVMAVLGYTTKADLSRLGSLLLMALIGIIIASLVNMFTHSEVVDYIISIAGVVIFTGLTAYDMQKIKQIGMMSIDNDDTTAKLTIHAALSLYLDFLNLFLYLLRFLGKRK